MMQIMYKGPNYIIKLWCFQAVGISSKTCAVRLIFSISKVDFLFFFLFQFEKKLQNLHKSYLKYFKAY